MFQRIPRLVLISIFTSQPNLIVDSGFHPSLHPNCHHQVVYANFNLEIHFPSPYQREICHYRQGNAALIRRAVHEFNWQRAFSNLNINERVSFFNKSIVNIVSNFIPHEAVICDDRDPPWINNRIKSLINDKTITLKISSQRQKQKRFEEFNKLLQNKIVNLTNDSRDRYYT